jgi:hypothetical protein
MESVNVLVEVKAVKEWKIYDEVHHEETPQIPHRYLFFIQNYLGGGRER